MSVINDAQRNRVCALDHYNIIFLLEYSSVYIHVVEYSECFITDARVCWRSV